MLRHATANKGIENGKGDVFLLDARLFPFVLIQPDGRLPNELDSPLFLHGGLFAIGWQKIPFERNLGLQIIRCKAGTVSSEYAIIVKRK